MKYSVWRRKKGADDDPFVFFTELISPSLNWLSMLKRFYQTYTERLARTKDALKILPLNRHTEFVYKST